MFSTCWWVVQSASDVESDTEAAEGEGGEGQTIIKLALVVELAELFRPGLIDGLDFGVDHVLRMGKKG